MSEQHRSPTGPPHESARSDASADAAAAGTTAADDALDATLGDDADDSDFIDQFTLANLATITNAISADFRRAVFAGILACGGLALTDTAGGVFGSANAPVAYFRHHIWLANVTAWAGAALFLIFGLIAVRSATKEILKTVPDRRGDNRKNGLRWICLLVGYLLVIFGTLGALNVPIERLLLGGAVTGVILGIAAQQSLGNLFAGLVLLVVRPIAIGQLISLRSGPLGGVLTGEVADMNLTYVRLSTDKGEILLPNSTILTATIGPPNIFDL